MTIPGQVGKTRAGTGSNFDRLARSQGYFEAHVSARRSGSPADAANTDLTFEVYRGPRTIVDINGIPQNTSLREEIERLWSEAVFDGFPARRSQERGARGDGPRRLYRGDDHHLHQASGRGRRKSIWSSRSSPAPSTRVASWLSPGRNTSARGGSKKSRASPRHGSIRRRSYGP